MKQILIYSSDSLVNESKHFEDLKKKIIIKVLRTRQR